MYNFYNYSELFKPEEIIDYLRKSQSDDPLLTVEEVLQRHETILDEWSERHLGAKVPEKNKFREVVSGETIKERPEINKVLRLIESPKYKAVKVVEPQRLTRGDLEDIGRLMKLLKFTNTYVITPERMYDLRDEYDWNAFEAELKRGNDYLKYTKKILNRGRLLSVSQGNYIGSAPPYGFNRVWVKDGKRKCPTLEAKEGEADVVRLIFDLYVSKDMGVHNICSYLDKMGVKPAKGKHWAPDTVRDMLENVHYIGKVKWNWRKTVTIVENSEIIKTRPTSKIGEFMIYEGKHDGLISEELFNLAQQKKGRNTRQAPSKELRNPLAGLLYCKCGRAMSLRTYKNKDGLEKSAPRLICDGQTHCKTSSVLYSAMLERVCDALRTCISDFEVRVANDDGSSVKLHNKLIKRLEKRKEELEEKEIAQWEAKSDPNPAKRMPEEIFEKLNAKLLKEKEEIQQALCAAYESTPDPIDYEEKIKTFSAALEALTNDNVKAAHKNRLLKACIDSIEYTRQRQDRAIGHNNGLTGWKDTPFEIDVKLRV